METIAYLGTFSACRSPIVYLIPICCLCAVALKLIAPHKIFLIRGNHEVKDVNGDFQVYGKTSFLYQCTCSIPCRCVLPCLLALSVSFNVRLFHFSSCCYLFRCVSSIITFFVRLLFYFLSLLFFGPYIRTFLIKIYIRFRMRSRRHGAVWADEGQARVGGV